jgi:hypothetical protein
MERVVAAGRVDRQAVREARAVAAEVERAPVLERDAVDAALSAPAQGEDHRQEARARAHVRVRVVAVAVEVARHAQLGRELGVRLGLVRADRDRAHARRRVDGSQALDREAVPEGAAGPVGGEQLLRPGARVGGEAVRRGVHPLGHRAHGVLGQRAFAVGGAQRVHARRGGEHADDADHQDRRRDGDLDQRECRARARVAAPVPGATHPSHQPPGSSSRLARRRG